MTSQRLLFQRRSHMASVKALRAMCSPLSSSPLPFPLSASRPHLTVPALTPAFHLCHPPHLSLSPSKLYFSAICFTTCAHPPFSLSLPALSVFFIIPPYSLIIFPDKLHSWTTSGLYSQALPIIFCPFKMRFFSEKCVRPHRIELPAAVICHRVINSKTPLLSWQLPIAGTQSVLVKRDLYVVYIVLPSHWAGMMFKFEFIF